jgi:hypothetical protein
MGLLDGELKGIIAEAAGFLFLDATLSRYSSVAGGTPDDPAISATPTTYSCKAIVEEFSERFRFDGTVNDGDVKVLVLAQTLSVTPVRGDIITVTGDKARKVLNIAKDPAGATWELRANG